MGNQVHVLPSKEQVRKAIFLIICILLSGCNDLHPAQKVGKWCESNDGGKTCFAYTSYFQDGTTFGYGNIEEYGVRFVGEGVWWHDDQLSCIEADFSIYDVSTNELVKKFHEQFCNKILKLNNSEFIYKDDKGIIHKMFLYSKTPNKLLQLR